jgi:pimeloyl-ACP methyl ester carboxylesterase
MAFVTASDGVKLYAEAHGAGIPLVLSCAYCTTHENFRPQVEPLVRAGARLVLWDYRGHGLSESPEEPEAYSMPQVVSDLGRVLDWAAPGRAAVVGGLSFGGLASLHFALEHPGRVRGLLLIDSGPGFKNPKAQAGWEAQIERTASFVERRGLEAFVASKAAQTLVGRNPEQSEARAAARAIAAQDSRGLANFGRRVSGPAPGVIDALTRIQVPALVVVGAEDEPFLRAAEVMAARLPRASQVTLAGAGHMVNLEVPDAFNRAVSEFLSSLPDDPT